MSVRRLILIPLLFQIATAAAAATGWTVDRLMHTLAQNAGGTVHFTERKYLAILDTPVESTGTLVYRRPDHLERHALTPRPESMVLDGNALTLTRPSGSLHMDLRDYPDAAALIESIRSTLAGDRAALERNYLLTLSGSQHAWTLDLSPSDTRIAALVVRIRIEGHGGQIDTVSVLQADGDRSEMRITPIPAAGS
ncbi:outer membrane lipoprotein carrier protein LolA [Nitrogeniibacter mangrovi]|uniref:Outer membrane lipoprotein carrier protein LolA n=1 Tax=Nitrogeniibacter mangrovi TaxID=2016596 RepID=A0A6C1B299_9RHOO|nr:LolA-related protein [Nitrogeniibacter mangrovi]QID16470.1 outer membrane lipoprotein carrier protein LolA [Nitrogeniibacter mangrovi]